MSKGGSRYGAGRPGYRLKAEQLHRLDVRDLARRGALKSAGAFSWSWHRGSEPSGNIAIHVESQNALTLRYTFTVRDVARDVIERVSIARTPCPYGGSRPWFHCTRCPRRVAVLYLRQGVFACRHCQRVAYSSQSDDALDRMWRKQAKIEARLGDNWRRPKGMRQCTYQRLIGTLNACEERRENAFAAFAARLFGGAGLESLGLLR